MTSVRRQGGVFTLVSLLFGLWRDGERLLLWRLTHIANNLLLNLLLDVVQLLQCVLLQSLPHQQVLGP